MKYTWWSFYTDKKLLCEFVENKGVECDIEATAAQSSEDSTNVALKGGEEHRVNNQMQNDAEIQYYV
jgi:hypothetical protein